MKKIPIYIIFILLIMANTGVAQVKGKCELFGHIIDEKTGEHLIYATVQVKGTTIGTISNASGHFILTGIPEGTQTIVVKLLGYIQLEEVLSFSVGKTQDVEFFLKPDIVSLDAVVISSSRSETSRREASSIVNVINPLVFETTNATVLSEGLCFTPGLRVENNCQNCGFQQVRINGLDGQYSQILIDSRPIISALSGVYGIEQIPAGMIERVEVLRGGGSALYGSNAIAGTINVITKEPLYNSGTVSHNLTMIGGKSAENTTNLNASLVSDNYKTGIYLFGNVKSRSPYDSDGDGYTEIAKLRGATAGFRGYYKTSNYSKLTLEYHNISEFRRGGDSLNLPPDRANIAEQTEHDINGGGVTFDIFSKNYKQKISLYTSMQYTDRKSYYGAGQDPNAYGATTDMTADGGAQYSYSFDKLWFMPAQLIGGIEYNFDHLNDEMPGYDRHTDQTARLGSVFLQNEWKNDKFSILLGGRLDKHNMISDPIFSPRLNFRYSPIKDIGLRASYAEGFRAPQTFSEDLHVLAAGGSVILIQLNPNLKPEHSRSVSGSADLYHEWGTVGANLLVEGFYTDLRDVFVLENMGYDAEGNIIQEKRNGSGADVRGITLEARVAFSKKYQLQGGFTFQKSTYKEPEVWSDDPDVPASKNMFRSPGMYGYFTASLGLLRDFTISLSGTYTGSMYVQHFAGYIPQDKLEKTSDFFDANFKLAYDFRLSGKTTLQLNAGMENIFNSYQKDFDKGPDRDSGYIYGPLYPRSWFIGIKFSL